MSELEPKHPHLQFDRESPAPERRSRRGFSSIAAPSDVRAHGGRLKRRLKAARRAAAEDLGGYDSRLLIKINLKQKIEPEDLVKASGDIEIVSQEGQTVVLAFATEAQLEKFEARLSSLSGGEHVPYENLLYALDGFDRWSAEDRTGWALKREGLPDSRTFVIDVELWTLGRRDEMQRLWKGFDTWIEEAGGEVVDSVRKPHLTVFRVRVTSAIANDILQHRDVRTVDLPPNVGLELGLVQTDIQALDSVQSPPRDAPGIAVLDSGVVTGHPVLEPAVGDAQSFLKGLPATDRHGHGTLVAGIALYGDVEQCLRSRRFVPELRLFSGRILNDESMGDAELVENQVENAVRYFVENYECRVFNLSYGDRNKPYQGSHVAGLAVTLDALSRELDVLFVVPTGNFEGHENGPDWLSEYPEYLTSDAAVLLDPAPALSAITVGSIAHYDQGMDHPPFTTDPAYRPIARAGEPSPFTRHGPSVNGAIKPDLVEFGGNLVFDARSNSREIVASRRTGEVSTCREVASGRAFAQECGTSFAAPRVAHAAAKLSGEFHLGSVDLCRAMLLAHARTPAACAQLFGADSEALRNVTGYGQVDRTALYRSAGDCVTLWAEESITNRHHHFYGIPIPASFWNGPSRLRELTVAIAYRPPVRTTRVDYRAVRFGFKLVLADSLDDVADSFDAAVDIESTLRILERTSGRRFNEQLRSKGTGQACTWTFQKPSAEVRSKSWFVVVTRVDSRWGERLSKAREKYALAVNLSDRSNPTLQLQGSLYAQVQSRLDQRIQLKGRLG